MLESAQRLRIPGSDDGLMDLLVSLSYTRYIHVWKKAADFLLEYQGDPSSHGSVKWTVEKQQALEILDLRNEAAEHFEDIRKELARLVLDDVQWYYSEA